MAASPRYWWCNTGGSDKVYAVFFKDDGSGTVLWGKRGGGLKSNLYNATVLADKIAERPAKQYKEITHSPDTIHVAIISAINSAAGTMAPTTTPTRKTSAVPFPPPPVATPAPPPPRILRPQVSPEEPGVVICVNNIGMDDKFTNGVDYLLKSIEGTNFFVVEDMFGVDQKVMQSRFKIDITQTRCV